MFLDDRASFNKAMTQGPSKEAAGVKIEVLNKAVVLKREPSMAVDLRKMCLGGGTFSAGHAWRLPKIQQGVGGGLYDRVRRHIQTGG